MFDKQSTAVGVKKQLLRDPHPLNIKISYDYLVHKYKGILMIKICTLVLTFYSHSKKKYNQKNSEEKGVRLNFNKLLDFLRN